VRPRTFDDLHHLIKKGDRAKVQTWVASGGDANLRNRYGWSLLDTAISLARQKGFNRTAKAIERAMGR
jgi:hypothetical protein